MNGIQNLQGVTRFANSLALFVSQGASSLTGENNDKHLANIATS